MATTATIRNGIDVDRRLEKIHGIQSDPAQGNSTFKASSTWSDGTHNTGQILGFTHAGQPDSTRTESFILEGNEPPVLLENNPGPNSVELVLQALGFCYTVGHAANVAAEGIEINKLEFQVEGDIDVRPFLGLEGPRPGFTAIRAHALVSSANATQEQLQSLPLRTGHLPGARLPGQPGPGQYHPRNRLKKATPWI